VTLGGRLCRWNYEAAKIVMKAMSQNTAKLAISISQLKGRPWSEKTLSKDLVNQKIRHGLVEPHCPTRTTFGLPEGEMHDRTHICHGVCDAKSIDHVEAHTMDERNREVGAASSHCPASVHNRLMKNAKFLYFVTAPSSRCFHHRRP
jgi:hypothetical protein